MLKSPIKWLGGKHSLKDEISEKIIPISFNKYIELFCGGLSIFFHLINIEKINKNTKVILNDNNKVLILFYKMIKENSELLIKKIKSICNSKIDYYDHRTKFNTLLLKFNENNNLNENDIELSALFLYLNKTCYNGLYRLNKKGLFNSSYNKKKYIIPKNEVENIKNISVIFNTFNINFKNENYENIKIDEKDTLVYLDPPYFKLNKTSFLYNNKFDFDQYFKNINLIKDSYIVCSNSFCEKVLENSKNFEIYKINSNKKINSNILDRKCKELLICNYFFV